MVCSGVPEKNDHHAAEVSKMGLDLLAKVYEIYKWAKMLKIVKQIYIHLCVGNVVVIFCDFTKKTTTVKQMRWPRMQVL